MCYTLHILPKGLLGFVCVDILAGEEQSIFWVIFI